MSRLWRAALVWMLVPPATFTVPPSAIAPDANAAAIASDLKDFSNVLDSLGAFEELNAPIPMTALRASVLWRAIATGSSSGVEARAQKEGQ